MSLDALANVAERSVRAAAHLASRAGRDRVIRDPFVGEQSFVAKIGERPGFATRALADDRSLSAA